MSAICLTIGRSWLPPDISGLTDSGPSLGSSVVEICTLADPQSRALWIGSKLVQNRADVPRHRALNRTTFYVAPTVANSDLVRIMGDGDIGFGSRMGHVSSLNVLCATGSYTLCRAEGWGVHDTDPTAIAYKIGRLHKLSTDAGLKRSRTASSCARQTFIEHFNGDLQAVPLRPQWRGLSHAAIHGGPGLCVSGGADLAVCMDINRAYWRALCEPMPVIGRWKSGNVICEGGYRATGEAWGAIRERVGIVEATVRLPDDTTTGYIPPLPAVDRGWDKGVIYPNGEFRGYWTIRHLRMAEDLYGAEVVEVHQGMVATATAPIFGAMMRWLDTSVHPDLAKLLYTRLYGIMASSGGWEVRRSAGRVEWKSLAIDLLSEAAPQLYRPDLAACVTGYNHETVFGALKRLDPSKTIATHIDSIWTADVAGAAKLDPSVWKAKRRGRVRYYGVGTYAVWPEDGSRVRCSAQGQSGPLTPESLGLSVDPNEHRGSRIWRGSYPSTHCDAESEAPLIAEQQRGALGHPSVLDLRWRR